MSTDAGFSRRFLPGNPDTENAALTKFGDSPDASTVLVHGLLGDEEPKAGACLLYTSDAADE